jgi:hypothetical protein
MTVRLTDEGVVMLEGVCSIDDAEALLRSLSANPSALVDWSACDQAHSAVIQVLMAVRPRMVGLPTDAFLRRHLDVLASEA